jgi:hypothetical protein
MVSKPWSVTTSAAAELIGKGEFAPKTYFQRQLNAFIKAGLVKPIGYRGIGKTRAALLGEAEVCQAKILSTLSHLGLQPSWLEAANNCLNNRSWDESADEALRGSRFGGFRGIIDSVRAGHTWFFVVELMPWSRVEGNKSPPIGGSFRQEIAPPKHSFSWMGIYTLPINALLSHILSAIGESDGSEAATPHRSRRRTPKSAPQVEPISDGDRLLV